MSAPTLKKIKGQDHTHNVKKVFSPVGISFKGSGFYKNDSAGKKKSKDSPKSASTDSKETKAESKPASTASESKSSTKSSDKASSS